MSLGLHYTVLDFQYIPTDSLTTLTIHDQSIYLEDPEKPLLQILVPGFVSKVTVPYNPKELTVLNSHTLGLTLYNDNFSQLPDGVYEITQMICPYDKLYVKKYILKDTVLKDKLYTFLTSSDNCCEVASLKKQICDFNIFLESAKAYAHNCNTNRATEFYSKAEKIITNLTSC